VKQQNNDKVIQDITEWIKRDATENPHSEIKLSLHVHGGRVAKIECGTGRSVPSGQDAQARLLAERFDNSTLEYELARCANKVNPLQYIAKYMLTDGYTSPMGTAPHRPSERAFPDADNSDPAFRELAERDSDFPWGGEVSDEQ
jgi:hypothetical protein